MPASNGSPTEENAPVSISSLRSKFESLAAANAGPAPNKPVAVPKPIGLRNNGVGVGNSGSNTKEQTSQHVSQSQPASRSTTPVPSKPVIPIKPVFNSTPASPGPPSPPRATSVFDRRPSDPPLPSQSTPDAVRSSETSSSLPVSSAQPVIVSPASPVASSSTDAVRERSISDAGFSGSRSSTPAPLSPKPTRRPAPAIPRAASPVATEEETPASSVKALRDRFNASGDASIINKTASSDGLKPSVPRPISALSNASVSSSTPGHVNEDPLQKPISRSGSPAPPPPNRATKPSMARNTPEVTPPGSGTQTPTETASPAPPLPVRKPTNPSPDTAAPPPISRNGVSTSARRSPSLTENGPPRLPQRSRAHTVTRSEDTRGAAPPPLPSRQATLAASRNSHSQSISFPITPEPSEYLAPPPPTRSAVVSPKKDTREERDFSSEDEEEGEPAPLSNLSTAAKRALEDYPDATHANRRPPTFVPDIRMVQPQHIYAVAVHGRHVATGAHHVRVYDHQMSEKPIFIVDLKETGLEFRIKEPRVTAMAFRPGSHPSDEGRYLWCGTKDGHIWELDIMTGKVTDTKAYAHATAVVNIFRYKQNVLTLDESGKLLVYDVPVSDEPESNYAIVLARTIRVSERFTFARMIGEYLWTATAPSARSGTTTAASKGATIRVFEPCAAGSSPPAKTLFTTEWTGSVTSATVIPLEPDTVYMGHEGGYISIWSVKDMACTQVLKVSATDILALEGVGERLWVGNRKGQISVHDVTQRPWLVTNVWTAHPDHPITMLLADPWAIEQTGRYAIWSTTRDAIRAWDGLLSVDWIDCQMALRQPDYCTYREVKALICSWNIDSAKPTDLSGSEANSTFLEQVLTSVNKPDIIVFAFQEVIPLTDKKLTAKTLLFGGKSKEAGATADKVSSAYRHWLDKLTSAIRMSTPQDCTYIKVHSESLVGLFTCVFVKADQSDKLRSIDICTVKRGLGNIYGNKGAIVARMVLDDTSLCFINVHLAAGQSQKAARNADLGAIMEDKAILPPAGGLPFVHGGDGTAILDHELVILNGDLNYRIDQRRENVLSNIAAGDLNYLLEHDQLRKEMRGNHAFRLRSFEEAPITFAPTYKYNRGSTEYDSSEKKRIPAWCDRILYTRSECIEPINYRRYEATISDHRPISAGFKLRVKSIDKAKMSRVRGEVGEEWTKREIEMLEKMVTALKAMV